MSDISDLKASVLEQAHEKGRLLLAEATEKIEQEAKEREAQLVRQKLVWFCYGAGGPLPQRSEKYPPQGLCRSL